MKLSKRFSSFLLSALVVSSSSVFLLPKTANAIGLQDNQRIIQQQSQQVAKKTYSLQSAQKDIVALESKKEQLSIELETARNDIDSLTKQIADKKAAAAAEAERVKQLEDMFVHIDKYAPDSSGNAYAPGNCTWYVKSKRPDIGNYWGNADMWYTNAAAQGWSVGLKPKKGAVATTTEGWAGHVAYVEGVSLDGQLVTISEMNYGGLYNMNTRTVPYTDFKYIYELD